uniref:Asparaginase-like sperm autoantigen n=1 Tax=Apis cerana TaxID=7461 RepID=V9II39_APICE
MKFDTIKRQYYDNVIKDLENIHIGNNFTFTEILPNGKLAIPTDSDTEDEKEVSNYINTIDAETTFLEKKNV